MSQDSEERDEMIAARMLGTLLTQRNSSHKANRTCLLPKSRKWLL